MNKDYFLRYVTRLDHIYRDTALDAIVCDVNQFHAVNEKYGRQFCDLVLRSIGIGIRKLARRTGGIGCRQGGDTFLLYCPHQDDYAQLLGDFTAEVFAGEETADKVSLRFGVYVDAQQATDIEDLEKPHFAANLTSENPVKQGFFAKYCLRKQGFSKLPIGERFARAGRAADSVKGTPTLRTCWTRQASSGSFRPRS